MRKDINKGRLCNVTTVCVESLGKRARRIREARSFVAPLCSARSKSSRRASATSPKNCDSPKKVFAKWYRSVGSLENKKAPKQHRPRVILFVAYRRDIPDISPRRYISRYPEIYAGAFPDNLMFNQWHARWGGEKKFFFFPPPSGVRAYVICLKVE